MSPIGEMTEEQDRRVDGIREDLNTISVDLQALATETGVRDLVLAATQAVGAALVLATVRSQRKEEKSNGKVDPPKSPPFPIAGLALDKRRPEDS